MARFNASDADNYGGQGGGGFFSLKNDGDVARVRFMYNSIDDVEGMSVHQVEVDGKKRYVDCLREYNEPVNKCPFCAKGMRTQAKLFIPVYDVDDDKVKIWERGKKWFSKISGLCSRYPKLVEKEFEIERHGKPGSTDTTYEVFPVDDGDRLSMEDLPEIPEDFERFVLKKSADDMEYFLSEGEFPPEEEDEAPKRRNSMNNGRNNRRNVKREDVDDNGDDELPFGYDYEEEDTRSSRKSSRQNTRRTPARRGNSDSF